jgi:hypothetical protein
MQSWLSQPWLQEMALQVEWFEKLKTFSPDSCSIHSNRADFKNKKKRKEKKRRKRKKKSPLSTTLTFSVNRSARCKLPDVTFPGL